MSDDSARALGGTVADVTDLRREGQRRTSSYERRVTRQLTEAAISPISNTINQSMG